MDVSYVVDHERTTDIFVSDYRVYYVTTDNIFVWICEVWYTVYRRRVTIDYLCVLYVGYGGKRRPRRIIR
jgi:hypothetical protein